MKVYRERFIKYHFQNRHHENLEKRLYHRRALKLWVSLERNDRRTWSVINQYRFPAAITYPVNPPTVSGTEITEEI